MADAVSYKRKEAHTITMPSELDEAFGKSELFDLPEYPTESKDAKYLEELRFKIEDKSKETGREVVLGVWLRPYGGPSQVAGFCYYDRKEAEKLLKLSKDEEYSVDPFFGFFSKNWFDERIAILKPKA